MDTTAIQRALVALGYPEVSGSGHPSPTVKFCSKEPLLLGRVLSPICSSARPSGRAKGWRPASPVGYPGGVLLGK